MSQIAILEAFAELEDPRRRAGQRHTLPLCLALFTLAIAAGNKGQGERILIYTKRATWYFGINTLTEKKISHSTLPNEAET